MRWALAGALAGALLALPFFAPASWLAGTLADATGGRLLLADARGTLWTGSAVVVLTGGAGSRDASALPGRLQWTLRPEGLALALRARQACCIADELRLRWVPGLGRARLELPAPAAGSAAPGSELGHWPASWLAGLGTPWNTLKPSGTLRLSSPGLALEQVQGRWRFTGQAVLELSELASRVSTLDVLGSYRLSITGDPGRGDAAQLQLSTLGGALQMSGSGVWLGSNTARLNFRGQASAAPGFEAVLANLLRLIGQPQAGRSVISIG